MKAVLMSIKPRWCELIASGKKTVEVRKTKPKIAPPFKVYIYCTKPNTGSTEDRFYIYLPPHDTPKQVNGTVIGEFVCDEIVEYESEFWDDETHEHINRVVHKTDWEGYPETESYYVAEDGEENYLCNSSCLSWEEMRNYIGQGFNTFYGWHISNLVIYDKPRELRFFFKPRTAEEIEADIAVAVLTCGIHGSPYTIKKPPQSWCYVEEA